MPNPKSADVGYALFLIGIALVFTGFLIQEFVSIKIGFCISFLGVMLGGIGVVIAFVMIVRNWLGEIEEK